MTNYKAILASYGRAFMAAAIACYMTGATDPKMLLSAGIAAILPPLLRWISPSDSTFGYVKVKDNNEH